MGLNWDTEKKSQTEQMRFMLVGHFFGGSLWLFKGLVLLKI